MSDKLSELLSGLTPSDVVVDPFGRIVITNPEVARELRELSEGATMLVPNQSCNHGCGG
ncbi:MULTISPECIES: hypothetical protein [Streptomyces]|uniref:PAS domain-containing protein n=1 Tax=Streptomyces lasiicapitis TaxID=1923961 RepID=A0ABQ2LLD8_9ACTN|nr:MULTISPECIES: hypothetical protein [Streptomyces]QIB42854.1 hypothetical protein G3H79_07010 [Streptomyces aureoverticillatus]GGO39484.1 hypothetical protein GCM10012286_16190 [Streptomyces lasiicapitis]